jgi:programmed cell death protein 4
MSSTGNSGSETPSSDNVIYEDITEGPVSKRAAKEEMIAASLGLVINSSAHQGPLLAGTNLSSRLEATTGESSDTLSLVEYKRRVDSILTEFFSAFDFDEASLAVSELFAPAFGNEFVKRLLIRAFEKDDMARENACRLLSSLELSPLKIGQGFLSLFESLNEVEKDAPMARDFAARFLARAVSDEILPPAFVTDEFTRRIAGLVVDDAIVLLTTEHSHERLHRLFHITGAFSVPELKKAVIDIVAEYLTNNDADEAVLAWKELGVQYFAHELIKKTITAALEHIKSDGEVGVIIMQVTRLFRALKTSGTVSISQMRLGFDRMKESLSDLKLDSPRSGPHFEALENTCIEIGLLS